MRISIGSDHRGVELKGRIRQWLEEQGHEVLDEGTFSPHSVDYPDYAQRVAARVARGEADRGILVCGTGIGMAIAANKVRGIRAGVCCDEQMAELGRRHNDLNVLCLPGGARQWEGIVRIWLETPFEGGRHARRLQKIAHLEQAGATETAAPPDSSAGN